MMVGTAVYERQYDFASTYHCDSPSFVSVSYIELSPLRFVSYLSEFDRTLTLNLINYHYHCYHIVINIKTSASLVPKKLHSLR
jgi:hypothetical protein